MRISAHPSARRLRGIVASVLLALLAGLAVLAVLARRRELRILQGQLPGIVASGLVSPAEAAWLTSLKARRQWVRDAKRRDRLAGRQAAALAADVTRYLDGEPVEAHRESAAERAGRVFRKYQTAIVLVLTYLLIRFLFLAARGL